MFHCASYCVNTSLRSVAMLRIANKRSLFYSLVEGNASHFSEEPPLRGVLRPTFFVVVWLPRFARQQPQNKFFGRALTPSSKVLTLLARSSEYYVFAAPLQHFSTDCSNLYWNAAPEKGLQASFQQAESWNPSDFWKQFQQAETLRFAKHCSFGARLPSGAATILFSSSTLKSGANKILLRRMLSSEGGCAPSEHPATLLLAPTRVKVVSGAQY